MKPAACFRATSLAVCAALLGACASTPSTPVFDPQADLQSQAATFITSNKDARKMGDAGKGAVLACNVMFAHRAAAHAGTGGGLFNHSGTTRAEAKVSVFYTLVGLADADYQRMTDAICAKAEQQLVAQGVQLVPRAELEANPQYQALRAAGRETPYDFKPPKGDSNARYMVYSAGGATLYDARYIGGMSGLGQAFKAVKGTSAEQMAASVMDQFGADAININLLVDFAELQSSGAARTWQLTDVDKAEVSGTVGLSISGDVSFRLARHMDCWDRFGKRECMVKNGNTPMFSSKLPVLMQEPFYESVVETTTTGDKAAAVLTKGIAILSAMSGVSGTSYDTTRYEVRVNPTQFGDTAVTGAERFVDMALLTAKTAR
jgi:hypothetical protein